MSEDTYAEVLLLGTFHMDNPGRDLINLVADDVLAPHRQEELETLAARLADFAPTKVCVERAPRAQDDLDASFARYLRGEAEPSRDEIVQIAFRLAQRCGVDRVHAIDDHTPMDWGQLEEFLAAHPDDDARFQREIAAEQEEIARTSERLARTPLASYLAEINAPDALRESAAWYVNIAGLGAIGEHPGADMLASWFHRNVRIFSNLCAITEPGDRIFVLFGSGHVPLLRYLLDLSARHRLVDTGAFLGDR
jgi:hypothetical protein